MMEPRPRGVLCWLGAACCRLVLAAMACALGCSSESSTIRLIIEAPSGGLPFDHIDLTVVGKEENPRDGGPDVCGCEETFWVSESTPLPIIVDLVRGSIYDEASIRVRWWAGTDMLGRRYEYLQWPEGGVRSYQVTLLEGCRHNICEEPPCDGPRCTCVGSQCEERPLLAQELLDDSWTGLCSGSCPAPAADGDADVEADDGRDADAEVDVEVGDVGE